MWTLFRITKEDWYKIGFLYAKSTAGSLKIFMGNACVNKIETYIFIGGKKGNNLYFDTSCQIRESIIQVRFLKRTEKHFFFFFANLTALYKKDKSTQNKFKGRANKARQLQYNSLEKNIQGVRER